MGQGIFDKRYLCRLSEILKADWREAPETEPDFLKDYPAAVQKENEERINRMAEEGKEGLGEYPGSFFAVSKRKKWKKRMEGMLEGILWEEPLLNIGGIMEEGELREFQACMKEFLRKVRKFDRDLPLEDMGQAVRNYMVYIIFLVLNGQEPKYRPAAFGYSMLYPYTDNYIDSPNRTEQEKEHYNRLIEGKLRGKKVRALIRHERKTAKLLEQVEIDYGRPHEVYEGLLLMLEAQEDSLRQEEQWKKGPDGTQEGQWKKEEDGDKEEQWRKGTYGCQEECRKNTINERKGGELGQEAAIQPERAAGGGEEDVLGISIYKGGVSVLMDRYFIDIPFTEGDFYFYYGFGFLLQLCDDLQDIVQDKEEGNPTAFSLCRTPGEAALKVNKLLHFTRKLFEACETQRQGFKSFLLDNCYLLILASAVRSREWIEEGWLSGMERRLPVRLEYLQKFGSGIPGAREAEGKAGEELMGEKERRKLMKMLDVLITD